MRILEFKDTANTTIVLNLDYVITIAYPALNEPTGTIISLIYSTIPGIIKYRVTQETADRIKKEIRNEGK